MRKILLGAVLVIFAVSGLIWWKSDHAVAPAKKPSGTTKTQAPTTAFDKTQHSTSDPASIWVIVNKQHPINPVTYAPADLRKPQVTLRVPAATEMQMRDEAAAALETMFAAAKNAGIDLQVSTAYRGYAYQKALYDGYVSSQGQASADTVSARPGYSEHQTGLAVDIRSVPDVCGLEACFGSTAAGKWLAANVHTYGYLLRYPSDKAAVTGYSYEPWHFRYIGTDLSQEMHSAGVTTLEEFFTVSGGDYN